MDGLIPNMTMELHRDAKGVIAMYPTFVIPCRQ